MFNIVGNNLYVGAVPTYVVKDIKKLYRQCLKNNYTVQNSEVCTVNGIQTKNVIPLISLKVNKVLMDYTINYIESYYNDLKEFSLDIWHLHIIQYKNGYQEKHNHSKNEDHSFILYCNDNEGSTRFYNDLSYYDVKPETNKIVFFNSACEHEGLVATDKFILVGGIRVNKQWKE